MNTSISKPVIFVVISILVVALIYAPSSSFSVPNRAGVQGKCDPIGGMGGSGGALMSCCWHETVPPGTGYEGGNKEMYCSECEDGGTRGMINCSEPELQFFEGRRPGLAVLPEGGVLEEPPTPPSGPAAPLQDGGVLQQTPGQGVAPPPTRGQGALPQDGVLQQPPAEDETTQRSTEPLPPCPEGQVLDEESGICVLEETEAAEEESAQSEPEEQSSGQEEQPPAEDENSN